MGNSPELARVTMMFTYPVNLDNYPSARSLTEAIAVDRKSYDGDSVGPEDVLSWAASDVEVRIEPADPQGDDAILAAQAQTLARTHLTAALAGLVVGHGGSGDPEDAYEQYLYAVADVAGIDLDAAVEATPAGCEQCATVAPLTPTEYGDLCGSCAYRQHQRDEARDNFDHLSPASLGFASDDE